MTTQTHPTARQFTQ